MDKRNRVYYVINFPTPETFKLIDKIKNIPSVKCNFRETRPHLIIGCHIEREQEVLTFIKQYTIYEKLEQPTLEPKTIDTKNIIISKEINDFRTTKAHFNQCKKATFVNGFVIELSVNGKVFYLREDMYKNIANNISNASCFLSYKETQLKLEALNENVKNLINIAKPLIENDTIDEFEYGTIMEEIRNVLTTTSNKFLKELFIAEFNAKKFGIKYKLRYVPFEKLVTN